MARLKHSNDSTWSAHVEAYRRGDKHYRAGRYHAALGEFRRALQLAPADSDTWWAIGNCHTDLHRPRLAESAFRSALRFAKPRDRAVLTYNLGNALFDQRRFQAAARWYRRVPPRSSIARATRRNLQLTNGSVLTSRSRGTRARAARAPHRERWATRAA